MSELLEIVVHGCAEPNAAALRAAVKVADLAVPLTGQLVHSRPVFVRHDTAIVDGVGRDVLVYVVKVWTRDDVDDTIHHRTRQRPIGDRRP